MSALSSSGASSTPPTARAAPDSPAAARAGRPSWRDPRLALGIALVAGCAVLGARILDRADDTVAVWALRSGSPDLVAGQSVGTEDLESKQVQFADETSADRYVSAQSDLPADSVLARDVGAGELLPRNALTRAGDAELVELPISVPTDSLPATLRVGSTVDVWVTGKQAAHASQVLDDVPVLALPLDAESLSPTTTRQVIVGLGPQQQAELPRSLAVLARGTLVLVRQPNR